MLGAASVATVVRATGGLTLKNGVSSVVLPTSVPLNSVSLGLRVTGISDDTGKETSEDMYVGASDDIVKYASEDV